MPTCSERIILPLAGCITGDAGRLLRTSEIAQNSSNRNFTECLILNCVSDIRSQRNMWKLKLKTDFRRVVKEWQFWAVYSHRGSSVELPEDLTMLSVRSAVVALQLARTTVARNCP